MSSPWDDEDPEEDFAAEETRGDSVPVFVPEDRDTRPHETIDDATFQAGRIAGRAEVAGTAEQWRAFGREEVFQALRFALIEGKTDGGVAHLQVERLRRWMEDPDNMALVAVVVQVRRPL